MSLVKKMQIPNKIVLQLSIVCVLVIDCYSWKGEVVESGIQSTPHGLLRLREINSTVVESLELKGSEIQRRNGSTLMTIKGSMGAEDKTFVDGKNILHNFVQGALGLKESIVQKRNGSAFMTLKEEKIKISMIFRQNGSTFMAIRKDIIKTPIIVGKSENDPINTKEEKIEIPNIIKNESIFMAMNEKRIKNQTLIDLYKNALMVMKEESVENQPIIRRRNVRALLTVIEDIIMDNKSKLMEITVPMIDGELQSQFSLHTLTNSSIHRATKESELLNGYLNDVVMVVHGRRKKASRWTFLKPLTPEMWLTTAAIMIYTALVIRLLEQKINPLSMMEIFALIWSAASTMSLTQNVRIESRSGRVVIAVWLLVMSIIVTSYADNFSSRLNVQETNPSITITNLNSLLATEAAVGYLKHNSKKYYRSENLRIDKQKLKAYRTPAQCAKALLEGPNKAGVVAVLMNSEDARQFVSERHGYTIYHISLWDFPTDTEMPKSLGVKDFLGWLVITATVSTLAVIIFFFNIIYSLTRDAIADTTEQDIDPQLEMLQTNEDSEEQSSVEGETLQTVLGTSNISKSEENASIEASSVYIPHIPDESHSVEEQDA